MQGLILKALFFAINRLIDAGLVEAIKQIVLIYVTNTSMTGEQKNAAVKESIKSLKGDLKKSYESTSSNLINLAVESAVVWAKSKTKV